MSRGQRGGIVHQLIPVACLQIPAVNEELDREMACFCCVARSIDVEVQAVFALRAIVI